MVHARTPKSRGEGYTLLQIHEVWHFPERRTGLFENYVNTWLKIKEEASGFPRDCVTPTQRQQHVDDYFQREHLQLDLASIAKKPWTSSSGQADVELHVGKVWSTARQNPRGGVY